MKKKLLSLLTLMLCVAGTAWGDTNYYTPTEDEVIIFNDVYSSTATSAGYSSHNAVAWAGTVSFNKKTAGDPSNNGSATSSTVNTFSAKGNGNGKNCTISISGVSKIIIYHEKQSERYVELRSGSKTGGLLGKSNASTYYTEVDLDGTKSYSIFLHGINSSNSDQDFYVYAIKLTKYVARTIDTQALAGVKVDGTALTENATSAGYSVSGSTITLTDVAYVQPTNVTLTNHIVYTDNTYEDKNVAVTFGTTASEGYWTGTATINSTKYTVKVPYEAQAVTAVTINGTAISAADLATLTSEKSVTINGSSLNGIGMIGVTLSGGTTTVSRANSGNGTVFSFTLNGSDNYTVTVTNVKKTYSEQGSVVYYSKDNTQAQGTNTVTLTANGISFSMENGTNTIQYGSGIVTLGSSNYQPIKLSTGTGINVTFPDYKKATKVTVYGWSAGGNGKLYSIKETNDASAKTVGDLSSNIFYATNTSSDIYPSVYEYELDNWESMYFSAGGSPSQPFVVMDFVLVDSRNVLESFTFSGGNTSVYTDAMAGFLAPTLAATFGGNDVVSDLNVTYASSNTAVATVDEATGEVTLTGTTGEAIITATFAGDATYQEASANYTIVVENNPIGDHTITYILDVTSSEDKNKEDINSINNATSSYLTSLVGITNNTGGSYTKGSKANMTVKIPTDASYNADHYMSVGFTVADGYRFTPSSISVKAQPVTTNKDVKLVLTNGTNTIEKNQTNLAQGSLTTVTVDNANKVSFTGAVTLKIYCYGATDAYRLGSPITIEGAVEEVVPISTLEDRNYASYVTTKQLDFGNADGITAYIATGLNSGSTAVVLQSVDVVPANTPIIVKTATQGATAYVPVTTGDASSITDNKLVAGDGTTTINVETDADTYYYLASDQFHKATSGTLVIGKAYMKLTGISPKNARAFTIGFEDYDVTGIESVETEKGLLDGEFYDLQGRRVAQPTKGLYIVNGKKVVVK